MLIQNLVLYKKLDILLIIIYFDYFQDYEKHSNLLKKIRYLVQ
jgi:hypothetical protein